jgi:hypothetical protein
MIARRKGFEKTNSGEAAGQLKKRTRRVERGGCVRAD